METTWEGQGMTRGATENGGHSLTLQERRRSLRAAAVGNMLEWYDWTIYGILSTYLAANFFSKSDPTSALLSTLAIFAGGFVARPLGGLVFGRFADGQGRRKALVISMLMLGGSSLGIALLPDYESIGLWAPFCLFVLRVTQGFAHGGESGVSYVYVAEIAPRERRGLWASSVFVSVVVGIMLATGVAAAMTSFLSESEMNEWGWRIGFAIGSVLSIYTLYLRRKANETEAFARIAKQKAMSAQRPRVPAKTMFKLVVLITGLNAAMNVWYYTWVVFAPALAIASHKMHPNGAYVASLCAQACTIVFLPLFGMLSDKIGRRPVIMLFGLAVAVFGIPIQSLISDQPVSLFVAQGLALIIWTIGVSIYPVLMAELIPAPVRGVGVGVVTSLTVAIFGGTAPYVNTWAASLGASWLFHAYIIALAVCTVIAGFVMKETKDDDLTRIQ